MFLMRCLFFSVAESIIFLAYLEILLYFFKSPRLRIRACSISNKNFHFRELSYILDIIFLWGVCPEKCCTSSFNTLLQLPTFTYFFISFIYQVLKYYVHLQNYIITVLYLVLKEPNALLYMYLINNYK